MRKCVNLGFTAKLLAALFILLLPGGCAQQAVPQETKAPETQAPQAATPQTKPPETTAPLAPAQKVIEGGVYLGPLIDAHMHLNTGVSIDSLIAAMDSAGIRRAVLFVSYPPPSLDYTKYPSRIIPFASVPPEQPNAPSAVRNALSSGNFYGVGELALRHFPFPMKPQGANIAADMQSVKQICDVAAEYGVPVTVHIDNKYVEELERLLEHNRKCIVVWGHAGNVPAAYPAYGGRVEAAKVKELLGRHANLYADLSAISPNFMKTSLLDANGALDASWKELFESYPERFFFGIDVFMPSQVAAVAEETRYWRKVLGQLPPETAEKIGYKNIERITKP